MSFFFFSFLFFFSPGSNGPECKHCKDDPKKTCRWCNCHTCGIKQDPDKQLLCDECDMAYHIYCLNPPLNSIPDDEDWSVDSEFSNVFIILTLAFPCSTVKFWNNFQISVKNSWWMLKECYMSCYCRYCPSCRNDASEVVLAGEKLKESKKKAKMASASSSSQRDWGKVMMRSGHDE